MEQKFYEFTGRDVRILAFELSVKNKIAHPFNKKLQMVGGDWLVGFRKRHPQLSLRSFESISIVRAQGFNKIMVSKYFDLLKDLMYKNNYSPHRIFDVEKTAVITTKAKKSKVLAVKGRRQVGAKSSAERGVLCTAAICMTAAGNFVPPMVIYPRRRMEIELNEGAPPCYLHNQKVGSVEQLILTSSPYENKPERELQEKEDKEKKKTQSTVRDVFNDETNLMKRRIQKKPSRKSKKQKVTASSEGSSSEEDNENPECLYCGDTYLRSRGGDGWSSCSKCRSWARDECAGVGDEELDFVCEKCL
ncbi:hypothetical protein JTB14_021563 [Gonioctena quinquepunctata]|nr:hypothetical protein JTB14_021563 [Gonioctena quinquepunctata]